MSGDREWRLSHPFLYTLPMCWNISAQIVLIWSSVRFLLPRAESIELEIMLFMRSKRVLPMVSICSSDSPAFLPSRFHTVSNLSRSRFIWLFARLFVIAIRSPLVLAFFRSSIGSSIGREPTELPDSFMASDSHFFGSLPISIRFSVVSAGITPSPFSR